MKKGLEIINSLSEVTDQLKMLLMIDDLPTSFKIFLKNYAVSDKMLNVEKLLYNDNYHFITHIKQFDNIVINGEGYSAVIDRIFTHQELLKEYKEYKSKTENWHDLGLMKIGILFFDDLLLIGMKEDNYGEIWRFGNGLLSEVSCKLDDNIFDFLNRLYEEINEDILEEFNIKSKDIYKNYGEEFWRVK